MKKLLLFLSIVSIASLLFYSCNENETPERELIYTTTTFSSAISCVAKSQSEDIVFIGLENGDVVIRNRATNAQKYLNVAENKRIYDIFEYLEGKDSLLLIGVRDEGLKLYRINNGSYEKCERVYLLKGNENRYSNYAVYDIELDSLNKRFFLGTSSGYYTLDINSIGENNIIPYGNTKFTSNYYSVTNIVCKNHKTYIASDSTLIVGQREKGNDTIVKTFPFKNSITNLFLKGDILYVCTKGSSICKINTNNDSLLGDISIKGNFNAYIQDELNGEWMISKYEITYKKANEKPVLQKIPQGVSLDGRQIACADKNFVTIACNKQLVDFSIHQNIIGKSSNVITICKIPKEELFYFLTEDGRLHWYKGGSHSTTIGKIKGIEITKKVIGSCIANDNMLWIATDNMLYKIDINKKRVVAPYNIQEIKSIYYDSTSNVLYIGTRYNLSYLNLNKRDDSVQKRIPDCELYVTDMCRLKDTLYIGTLNKGLFCISQDIANNKIDTLLTGDHSYGEIKNLMAENGDKVLWVYTSKGFYTFDSYNSMTKKMSNINPKELQSIFTDVNNNFFLVGYNGFAVVNIREIDAHKSFYGKDIVLNRSAIVVTDKKAIAGGESGLYKCDFNSKEKIQPISIDAPKENPVQRFAKRFYWLILIILGVSLLVISYFLFKKNRNIEKLNIELEQTQKEKNDLDTIVTNLAEYLQVKKENLHSTILKMKNDLEKEIDLLKRKMEEIQSNYDHSKSLYKNLQNDMEKEKKEKQKYEDEFSEIRQRRENRDERAKELNLEIADIEYLKLLAAGQSNITEKLIEKLNRKIKEKEITENLKNEIEENLSSLKELKDPSGSGRQRKIAKKLEVNNSANEIITKAFEKELIYADEIKLPPLQKNNRSDT